MNEARQIGKVKDKPDVGQTAGGVTECDQMAVACGTKVDNDKLEVGRTTAGVCDCDEMAGACGVKVNMEDNIIDISDDDIEGKSIPCLFDFYSCCLQYYRCSP